MAYTDKLRDMVSDKKTAVLGVGLSNRPLIDMLLSFGADVTVHDIKSAEKLKDTYTYLVSKGVKTVLGPDYLSKIDADVIFRSPGIRPDYPGILRAQANNAVLTSEMQVFFEICPAKIIAVTGSDGKTTTTTVISKLLSKAGKNVYLGGNIGRPLLPLVDQMCEDDFAIVELSSFQLQTMTRSPHVAVITNVSPNHLDWHKDMDEYIAAKANILKYQTKMDRAVLNYENEVTNALKKSARGETVFFSSKREIETGVCEKDGFICRNGEKVVKVGDIKLPGRHNVENYMAAIAATYDWVGADDVREVALSFGGVEHRCEFVRELDGVMYYNSSIDSSPTRTIAALSNFNERVILLCGGYDKHLDYTLLGPPMCRFAKAVIVTGATKEKIKNALLSCPEYDKKTTALYEAKDYGEAVSIAHDIAKRGDRVILSPASASFDCFENFMERGNFFKNAVNSLK